MAEQPQDTPSSTERTMIRKALEQAHRDKALAARLLGISQTELQSRMQVYGLAVDGLPEE
jgi:transcriptional regulator with PAS, ATPase and Fis domain